MSADKAKKGVIITGILYHFPKDGYDLRNEYQE